MDAPQPPSDSPDSLAAKLRAAYGEAVDPEVSLHAQEEKADGDADFSTSLITRLSGRSPSFGRYKLKGEIARGGMGAILKIWDEDLRRHLAMKVVLAQAEIPKVARFVEEAQVTGQLDHPGIVPVHELGLDPTRRVYFTMKLVKGRSLKEVFDLVASGEEGWTQMKALGVLLKVCEAMAYAHDKGVIHRDLKPANIMVGKFGEVYVMDWGLARIQGMSDRKNIRLQPKLPVESTELRSDRDECRGKTPDSPLCTMDGDVVGTPAYMPPEQATGKLEEVGPHSDVYAVGAMLYHLLAGHMPYVPLDARLNNYAVWSRVQEGPPAKIATLARETPAELVAICEKAMARDWKRRYRDMSEMAADLAAFLEHRVVAAYETGAWAEMKKWVERNKPLALSLAAGLLALVSGLVVSLSLKARADASAALARLEKANVLRLSAFQTLDDLEKEADTLWPAIPANIEKMRDWLRRAESLVDEVPHHRATLAEIEARATPTAEASGAAAVGDRRFAENEDRWWHAQVEKLIAALVAFGDENTGLLRGISPQWGEGVGRRLAFAETVEERTITGADANRRWNEAIEAIARSATYAGTRWPSGDRLAPQLGLLPLGPDPDSGLWEFAHLQTGEPPVRGADRKLVLTEETGLVFVLIPGGSFAMGAQRTDPTAPHYDRSAQPDESPVREVSLVPFFLSKYEMTQGQWERIAGANPSQYAAGNSFGGKETTRLHPVEHVTWDECSRAMARLALVLPTEAQWEYAARAGTSTPWWTGDDVRTLDGAANLADRYCKANGGDPSWTYEESIDDGYTVHAPVGRYRPNAFGLYDVHGNVWEWCRDGYGAYTLPVRPGDGEREGTAPRLRTFRGGCWTVVADSVRVSNRGRYDPGIALGFLGLRPARVVEGPSAPPSPDDGR